MNSLIFILDILLDKQILISHQNESFRFHTSELLELFSLIYAAFIINLNRNVRHLTFNVFNIVSSGFTWESFDFTLVKFLQFFNFILFYYIMKMNAWTNRRFYISVLWAISIALLFPCGLTFVPCILLSQCTFFPECLCGRTEVRWYLSGLNFISFKLLISNFTIFIVLVKQYTFEIGILWHRYKFVMWCFIFVHTNCINPRFKIKCKSEQLY